ncbi:MAG TPA: cytochrome c [Polyangiales bacterium]|nr:cytochrome c [Polyangiales bacterium]
MTTRLVATRALALGLAWASLAGCRGETSKEPPIVPIRNMYHQQRYNPQARSAFFEDGRTMRKPVEHTFSREMIIDAEIANGEFPDGSGYVLTTPNNVIVALGGPDAAVHRGQERYNIYCRPCHDEAGTGKGTAVKRGMAAPPSLHEERIRKAPDGQLFATISNGVRNMPAYSYSIPVHDRWAIVNYVRALEVSQVGER